MDWMTILMPAGSAFIGTLIAVAVVKADVSNMRQVLNTLYEEHRDTRSIVSEHIQDHAKGVFRER